MVIGGYRALVQQDEQFTSADWGLFVSVAVIWGASFLFIDIGLDALPPGVITLMRVGLGALALAVLPLPRQHTKIRPEDRFRIVTLSVVWVAIPFTLFPIAEQHISSAVAGLLNGGTPIFAAIFAMALLGQATRGAQLLGIAVGFVGVVFVSLPSIGEGSSETFGVALVVLATVCYGFAITLAGPMQQRYGSVNLMAKVLALATIWTVPCTSITFVESLPAFWCSPSMFCVTSPWSCPRRSNSTIAPWPRFGSAVHAGVVRRFCHAAARTSGSPR